jgi:alkanesulfonate monooxygenase SsuD/methylene tetrahydromethanopterin reductase-like flavin-dependent oxidoreductase (luciferase family)
MSEDPIEKTIKTLQALCRNEEMMKFAREHADCFAFSSPQSEARQRLQERHERAREMLRERQADERARAEKSDREDGPSW